MAWVVSQCAAKELQGLLVISLLEIQQPYRCEQLGIVGREFQCLLSVNTTRAMVLFVVAVGNSAGREGAAARTGIHR